MSVPPTNSTSCAGMPEVTSNSRLVASPDLRPASAYTQSMPESRIVADHRIMGGVPCIRGTRIPVATVVGLVALGQSVQEILVDYPQLSDEDVRAAPEFAAMAVGERQVPLRTSA